MVFTSEDAPLAKLAEERLRAEGGRMTSQRRLILETLESCSDHPSAEEIFEQARLSDNSLHLSTVYRTLRWLEEVGLVNPRRFEDEPSLQRFDPIGAYHGDHYHFRCRNCNAIIEFSEPLLEEIKAGYEQRCGGLVESASLTLYGLCVDCEQRLSTESSNSDSR